MAKTIQVALSPLLIIGAFCGLGFLEYPVGQPRLYLTCLYFLIAWSFYIYLYYYFLIYTNYATTNVYILSWTNIIIILSATLSMFVSLFRFQVGIINCSNLLCFNLCTRILKYFSLRELILIFLNE